MKYIAPEIDLKIFTCPICNSISGQKWKTWELLCDSEDAYGLFPPNFFPIKFENEEQEKIVDRLKLSTCDACEEYHIWLNDKMIFPIVSNIPVANEDMPETVKAVYNEAREVQSISKKSAAALLRLGVQLLCKELGESGENINNDIASLVSKGLDSSVQKMLDTLRIVGNNAVHPGEIDLDDRNDISVSLFSLLNFIVDEMISKPKKIEEMYGVIPENLRNKIDIRNERAKR